MSAGQRHHGELAAAISNAVVAALSRTTGRGPTKAKTTLGDSGVFVVLQDSLTRGGDNHFDPDLAVEVFVLEPLPTASS